MKRLYFTIFIAILTCFIVSGWAEMLAKNMMNKNDGIVSIEEVYSDSKTQNFTVTYSDGKIDKFSVKSDEYGVNTIEAETNEDGNTPIITIGDNGNWFVDGVDSEIKAKEFGDTSKGVSSIQKTSSNNCKETYQITYSNGMTSSFSVLYDDSGIRGIESKDEELITINENGNWCINGKDSTKSIGSIKGDISSSVSSIKMTETNDSISSYEITYTNGDVSSFSLRTNKDNANLEVLSIDSEAKNVVTIGENGNWYINGSDSYKYAGFTGADTSKGVSSIAKVSTDGLDDIYEITYTNGSNAQFIVKNREEGINSIEALDNNLGNLPTITIGDNGNWYINGSDSYKEAKGIDGSNLLHDISEYELYLEAHPDYNKSESEWKSDIKNGYLDHNLIHLITFDYGDGKPEIYKVEHNSVLSTPIVRDRKGYTFSHWEYSNREFEFNNDLVTKNMAFKAIYDRIPDEYFVIYKDYDGSILYVDLVGKGETSSFGGVNPIPSTTQDYEYTFSGWAYNDSIFTDIKNVKEDMVLTPSFDIRRVNYHVYWYDGNDNLIKEDTLNVNEYPVYTGNELYMSHPNEDYSYQFKSWHIEGLENFNINKYSNENTLDVLGTNIKATALFYEVRDYYNVNYRNYDGTIIYSEKVKVGNTTKFDAFSHKVLTKESDNKDYKYEFASWNISSTEDSSINGKLLNISSNIPAYNVDLDITASLEYVRTKYHVYWLSSDGTILKEDIVLPHENSKYDLDCPIDFENGNYSYSFNGFYNVQDNTLLSNNLEVDNVISDVYLYASFIKQYPIEQDNKNSNEDDLPINNYNAIIPNELLIINNNVLTDEAFIIPVNTYNNFGVIKIDSGIDYDSIESHNISVPNSFLNIKDDSFNGGTLILRAF